MVCQIDIRHITIIKKSTATYTKKLYQKVIPNDLTHDVAIVMSSFLIE